MAKAYLEIDEVRKLEDAAEYLRDKLLVRLLSHLGCRISEALDIGVSDIDFDQGTITIQHLKVRLNLSCPDCSARLSKTAKFCPGCGRKVEKALAREREYRRVRTLPIDSDTLEMLKAYIEEGGPISSNGKQLLFGIGRNRAWEIIRDCAKRAGLEDLVYSESGKRHHVSPHRLRDAFAVLAVQRDDSGDGLRLLQEHLGHQNISTTMKYRRISGKEQREWYDGIMEARDDYRGNNNSQR